MRYFLDLLKLIISRWSNSKRLASLTLINLFIAIFILTIFVNVGVNTNRYIKNNFFSAERLRHIVISAKPNIEMPLEPDFLMDDKVDEVRIIYATNIDVISINDIDYSSIINLDISVMESKDLLFEGEYYTGDKFKYKLPDADWKEGVVLSERCLAIFDGKDPIGAMVKFSFNDEEYLLPIVAIVSTDAEENYDFEYRSFMYVFSEALSVYPQTCEILDVRLGDIGEIKEYLNSYNFDNYVVLSNMDEINRILSLSNIVVFILIFTGLSFALFASIGIINSLAYLQDINIKSSCLLKIVGFSEKDIMLLDFLESMLFGLVSFGINLILFWIVSHAIIVSGFFDFRFIETNSLFTINCGVIFFCFFESLFIVIVCKLLASGRIGVYNLLDFLKEEE